MDSSDEEEQIQNDKPAMTDAEQDVLDAEIKRSEGVDSEQDKKIKDIETKLGEGPMYETDEK